MAREVRYFLLEKRMSKACLLDQVSDEHKPGQAHRRIRTDIIRIQKCPECFAHPNRIGPEGTGPHPRYQRETMCAEARCQHAATPAGPARRHTTRRQASLDPCFAGVQPASTAVTASLSVPGNRYRKRQPHSPMASSCNAFLSRTSKDPLSAATLTCILLVLFSLCLIGCSGYIDPIGPPPGRGTFYPTPQIRWQSPLWSYLQRG